MKLFKNPYYRSCFFCLALSLINSTGFAQKGSLFTTDFFLEQITQDTKCEAITEDDKGNMFFAVPQGVIVFDGKTWRTISTPAKPKVLKTLNDQVFVGLVNGFGVLKKINHVYEFKVIIEYTNNEEVREITTAKEHLYVLTKYEIFKLKKSDFSLVETYRANKAYHGFVTFHRQLFCLDGNDVYDFQSSEEVIPGFSFGVKGKVLFAIAVNETKTVIGTDSNYLYIHGQDGLELFKTDADAYLKSGKIGKAELISNDIIAISTLNAGCLIIDVSESKVIYKINDQTGLPVQGIVSIYVDRNTGLWIGHRLGATRVAWDVPVHNYNVYPGIGGGVTAVNILNKRLYVASSHGVYYLDEIKTMAEIKPWLSSRKDTKETRRDLDNPEEVGLRQELTFSSEVGMNYIYRKVEGLDVKCQKLHVCNNGMLVGASDGLYFLRDSVAEKIIDGVYVLEIEPAAEKNKYFIGCQDGLLVVVKNGFFWEVEDFRRIVNVPVYSIIEQNDGSLWTGTDGSVWHVKLSHTYHHKNIDIFDFDSPFAEKVIVRKVNGVLYFFISSGIYFYDNAAKKIVPGEHNGNLWLRMNAVIAAQPDVTWLNKGNGWTGLLTELNDRNIEDKYLQLFENVVHIYLEDDGTFWVVDRKNHIYRIEKPSILRRSGKFKLLKKWVLEGEDNYLSDYSFRLPHDYKSLSIAVAAPEYLRPESILFQYKITGMKDWAEWTSSNVFNIPFLPVGRHEINIQARNIYGDISNRVTFDLVVLPPFYNTSWFFVLCIIGLVVMVVMIIRWRLRTMSMRNKVLEERVKIRTNMLEAAKQKADELLLNILPYQTVEELKENGQSEAKFYPSCSVLFSDFKGFTKVAATLLAKDVIKELDESFQAFDDIIEKYGLEKIKTMGDAYMCVSGVPKKHEYHGVKVVLAALEILEWQKFHRLQKLETFPDFWNIRVGINSGPVVAGVIGKKKFAYDIWGDTVNIAARMESNSKEDRVNISQSTYDLIYPYFIISDRGEIEVKGRGSLKMYFVERIKPDFSEDELGYLPNDKLMNLIR